MPAANTGMGVREIVENRARGAWTHEYNVTSNSATDQSPLLDSVLDTVVLANSGKDYAPMYIRPGKIRLGSTWVIHRARACRFQGAGRTVNNQGPRNHGGSSTMSGSDLYWAGFPGGTAIEVNETSFAQFDSFSLYLDETAGASQAGIGVWWKQDVVHGHGNNSVRECSVVAMAHGGIGFQFGTSTLSLNVDTFYLERTRFQNLATGCKWLSEQNMEWSFVCPQFQNVDTWLHFVNGGNIWLYGFQSQDARSNANIVLIKVDSATSSQGFYHINGGYLDRQGNNTWVSIFEPSISVQNARFSAHQVNIRHNTSGTSYDGNQRAFVEAYGGQTFSLTDCTLRSQSIVRWRTTAANQNRGHVHVSGCTVDNVLFGSQLCTCNEGGFAGAATFTNVTRQGTNQQQSVTVNLFPISGSRYTHVDIDNFDASDIPSLPAWNTCWLGGGTASSPPWSGSVVGYYPFDEPIGATLATDRVNISALDLAIDSDMQVPNPPMPFLGQWCDFSKSDSTHGRDTGISINPAFENLTVFGFIDLETRTSGRTAFSVNVSGDPDFQIARVVDSFGALGCGRAGGIVTTFMSTFRTHSPIFLVVSINAGADLWDAYVNGTKVLTKTSAGYSSTSAGTVYIGGRNALSQTNWPGRMSRVGIVKAYLSAKEASILSMQASTCGERRHRFPL